MATADPARGDNTRLGINPDKVRYVIQQARLFDVKEATDDTTTEEAGEDEYAPLEDLADDGTRQEFMAYLRGLDEEEQINLVALAWVGRGTYQASEWSEALRVARAEHNNRTPQYLMGLPLLGDYLEEGLSAVEEAEEEKVRVVKKQGTGVGKDSANRDSGR